MKHFLSKKSEEIEKIEILKKKFFGGIEKPYSLCLKLEKYLLMCKISALYLVWLSRDALKHGDYKVPRSDLGT